MSTAGGGAAGSKSDAVAGAAPAPDLVERVTNDERSDDLWSPGGTGPILRGILGNRRKGGAKAVEDPQRGTSRPRTFDAVAIASLVVALLTAVFVIQNTEPATVNFFAWKATVPLAVALLLAAVLGVLLGALLTLLSPLMTRFGRLPGRGPTRAR